MQELTLISRLSLYVLLAMTGLLAVVILDWQIKILRGRALKNPDGSVDDWHAQKTHYGIAFADVVWACPGSLLGIALVFLAPRWGFYLLALVSFWAVWANTVTTATSLRFQRPKRTLMWFISFPAPGLVGLAYIVWTIIHFDVIYLP